LRPGRLYVLDRGYAGYWLLRAILDAGSSFVMRVKDNVAYAAAEERPLTEADRAAGVVRDVIARRLGTDRHRDEVGQAVRLIWTRRDGEAADDWVLCTDRLELDADLVVQAYRYRWWIELFFRWLKCILGCRHLLGESPQGVTLQVYMALLASLLITLWAGRKATKRTFEMFCFYFMGWASEQELQRHIEQLQEHDSS
jgi:IS4 transposase